MGGSQSLTSLFIGAHVVPSFWLRRHRLVTCVEFLLPKRTLDSLGGKLSASCLRIVLILIPVR